MNLLEKKLLKAAEIELSLDATFIEKDWYGVQLLHALVHWEYEGIVPVFTGGTSLSKAHRVIHRFSEDIDIRLAGLHTIGRGQRSAIKRDLIRWLESQGWTVESVQAKNENRNIEIQLQYPASKANSGLRPFLKLELVFHNPRLACITHPVRSLIAGLTKSPSEIEAIACVSLSEIAAKKLSALSWRLTDSPGKDRRDLVRHLHDLAHLSENLIQDTGFKPLFLEIVTADIQARTEDSSIAIAVRLAQMMTLLANEGQNYSNYVKLMSYAVQDASPPQFDEALARLEMFIRNIHP